MKKKMSAKTRRVFTGIKKKHRPVRILAAFLVLIVLLCFAYCIFIFYPASEEALASLEAAHADYEVIREGKDWCFAPVTETTEMSDTGLIFYPGAGVQCEAYAPFMEALAERGIFCVLVEMPGNFALCRISAAEKIQKENPSITQWYIGGHSLGGVAAAICAETHEEDFDGILFCASYSISDLSESGMKALSVYGSEDTVLNKTQYSDNRDNLPEDTEEFIIDGGCHSYFGDYGTQKGDGTPTISREKQIEEAADAFMKMAEK